ncbi:tRNA glutamyl-Q(34) synthetase GluQRS [Marinomonas sp. IMCC 4694]|nr:tRNA glutamyl-Q(34) synthetase GluQRS [Marinomonas sp. IMCC 4694]
MSHHTNDDATRYRGRFAPSPTGPLHFGSLVSALASFLDAKKNQGDWIIRLEDVDGTRCKAQYTEDILATLHSYCLFSDEPIRIQSQHTEEYEQHLSRLKKSQAVFACNCTRQSLAQYRGQHPHVCTSTTNTNAPHSWRLKASDTPYFCDDSIQGRLSFVDDLKYNSPVLKRKDGYFSYQLAVVVDDHQQGITHLVRGADLIDTTAHQLHLYHLLNWTPPSMCHIPLIINQHGDKISKQNHAKAIQNGHLPTLLRALHYLNIDLSTVHTIEDALRLSTQQWAPETLRGSQNRPLKPQDQHFL